MWQLDTEARDVLEVAALPEVKKTFGKKAEAAKEKPAVKVKVGKFSHLDESWKPLYKLMFREPGEEEELAMVCIQGFVVLDRPELAADPVAAGSRGSSRRASGGEGGEGEDGEAGEAEGEEGEAEEQEDQGPVVKAIPTFILVGSLLLPPQCGVHTSLAYYHLPRQVGSLQGGVFRANLASCSITVDTGDLVCTMEWYKVATPVLDLFPA